MNRIVLIYYVVGIFFLNGCQFYRTQTNVNDDIKEAFKIYGRNTIINSQVFDSIISFDVNVYSPSFLDPETHKLLLSLVCYENKKKLKVYKEVYFNYVVEGLENDTLYYSLNPNSLSNIIKKFEANKKFLKICHYTFNNITNDDLIKYNLIINNLNSLMPNEFDFNGSFWLLLNKTTEDSFDDKQKYYKYFVMFSNASRIDEYELEYNHIDEIDKVLNRNN